MGILLVTENSFKAPNDVKRTYIDNFSHFGLNGLALVSFIGLSCE